MALSNTLTNNINFLQPSQFRVIVNRKRFGNFEFFAQTFNHPSVSVNPTPVPYSRISNLALPGDTISFEELSFDVIVDEDISAYIEMFQWMKQGVERNIQRNTTTDLGSEYTHEADITVNILSSHNNTTKTFKYANCIPTSLGVLSMASTTSDTQVITFPVTFRTSYFEIS